MSIRKQILEAMKVAAMQAPSLQGPEVRVFRSRTAAISSGESPALIIRPADESVNPMNEVAERDFSVQLLILARGDVPDDIADAVIEEVHPLFAADPSFGGLAAQMFETSSNWTYGDGDEPICELDVRYRVRLYTPESSLGDLA